MSDDSQRPLDSLPETATTTGDQEEKVPGANRPAIPPPPILPNLADDTDESIDVIMPDPFPNPAPALDDSDGASKPSGMVRRVLWSLLAAVVLTASFTAGYYTAWAKIPKTSYDPFTNYCGDTKASLNEEAMHRRNQIWRAWNGLDVDSDSGLIAAAVAIKLRPDLDSPRLTLLGDLVLESKWITQTDNPEIIKEALTSSSPLERAQAILDMMKADAQAGEVIRQVICDDRRIGLFLQKKTVPLEIMPSGIAP